jgi:hypothetical protein
MFMRRCVLVPFGTVTGNVLLVKAIYVIHLSMALLPPPCCLVPSQLTKHACIVV